MYKIPTPLRIEYNTDYYFDPDEEDLQDKYIVGIEDAEGKTVLYTDSGYFKISEERAQYLVKAVDSYQAMKEALEKLVERFEIVNHWANEMYPELGYDEQPNELVDNELEIRQAKQALTLANGGQS